MNLILLLTLLTIHIPSKSVSSYYTVTLTNLEDQMSDKKIVFEDGNAYERMMGVWSQIVGKEFIE